MQPSKPGRLTWLTSFMTGSLQSNMGSCPERRDAQNWCPGLEGCGLPLPPQPAPACSLNGCSEHPWLQPVPCNKFVSELRVAVRR